MVLQGALWRGRVISGVLLSAVLGAATGARAQWAPPYLEIQRVGLFDAQHTDAGGNQGSHFITSSPSGHLVGTSYRLIGATGVPQSAWIWTSDAGTVRLGYADAEHTAADGSQSSTPRAVADGRAVGTSLRYNSAASAGQSAWVWTTTGGHVRLGYTDAEHTAADGSQFSDVIAVNDAGRAIGISYRYGSLDFMQTAWTWTPVGGTLRLGFTDSAHTSSTGVQYSNTVALNAAGQVVGSSRRYAGTAQRGESAWAWSDSGGTIRIGLLDTQHTSSLGQQTSRPTALNASGRAIGTSARFQGPFYAGDSSWTWSATGGTVQVGLTDAGHTKASGSRYSTATAMNNAGLVIGYSQRFNGAAETGQSAWVWSEVGGTVRLGYTDASHTGSAGYQHSAALRVGAGGAVIGYSTRYIASVDAGTSAWLWTSPTGLVSLGLVDAQHTRLDGYRGSWPIAINAAGQVTGTSERYNGGATWLGNDGWFYDPATGLTAALTFSVSDDGRVSTAPALITDSGWVLGNHTLFAGNTEIGNRAFIWSAAQGYAQLGSLVEGGLASKGWSELTHAYVASESGSIFGYGLPLGATPSSLGVYVLTAPHAPCLSADIGTTGGIPGVDGELNNNDFIVFIDWFFARNPAADRGTTGGVPASDGHFDNNDFIVFIDQFFAAC